MNVKSATKVFNCTCKHVFQDKRYGKNKRLHNLRKKDGGYTCTVCGKIKL